MALTRTQLASLMRDYVQESSTTPLSAAIANDFCNQALEQLAEDSGYLAATYTDVFVVNTHDYALPGDLIHIQSVAWNNGTSQRVLHPFVTLRELEDKQETWRADVAARPERWWLFGQALWVHPKPSATYAGTTLEIKGSTLPAAMTTDSSTPQSLPDRFHRTIAKGAAWLWLSTDKENPTAAKWAGYWQGQYEKDVKKLMHLVHGRTDLDAPGLRIQGYRGSATGGLVIDEGDD